MSVLSARALNYGSGQSDSEILGVTRVENIKQRRQLSEKALDERNRTIG